MVFKYLGLRAFSRLLISRAFFLGGLCLSSIEYAISSVDFLCWGGCGLGVVRGRPGFGAGPV